MRRPRSQVPRDLDAVDVLLVEDDEDDVAADEVRTVLHELALEAMARRATWSGEPLPDPDDAPAAPDPPHPVLRVARRYRRQVVTGAVVAVAVAVTPAVLDARERAARAAALAATPAVLAEMSGPPAEAWRVPGRVVGGLRDVLLVVDGASLEAVHPGTGQVTWTASAEAGLAAATGDCFPVDERLLPGRAPLDDGAGPSGLVACGAGAAGDETDGDAPGTRIVVLDSATGRTRHTVTGDGALLLAEPVERDLLVVTAAADSRARITRWDLASGTPRWDRTSPLPVLTDGAADAARRRPASVTVGAFAVDLRTGEEVESDELAPYEEHVLPRGGRATWSWRDDGTSGRGRVSGGAGSMFFLPGPPLRPPISDGSDAGMLVVRTADGSRLRGMALRSGRLEWTRPTPDTSTLRATALVDGVLLLDDDDTVTALDVRTGDEIWRAQVHADATDGAALTDGDVVLLPVRSDDGTVGVVASRIADGTEVWRTAAPPGTASLTVVDRQLIASTGAEVIGLG